jgi:hypothetical protein
VVQSSKTLYVGLNESNAVANAPELLVDPSLVPPPVVPPQVESPPTEGRAQLHGRGAAMTGLPSPDVYIASLGRSGSTLIANLMTTPPDRLVLVETQLHRGGGYAGMFDQMARWGWQVGADELARWQKPPPGQSPAERAAAVLADRLIGLARWGVKEVDPTAHKPGIALLRPKRVIVLVRDIRDVMLSFVEKFQREGRSDYSGEIRWRLIDGARVMTWLADGQCGGGPMRIVRYEDFVASADERAALARWLDWPLDGDPDRNLDLYRRNYEIERHRGVVSQVSVGRRAQVAGTATGVLVARMGEFLARYQRRFGYNS